MNTPMRSVRVPDDLWDAAAALAEQRHENMSTVIRRALRAYVTEETQP